MHKRCRVAVVVVLILIASQAVAATKAEKARQKVLAAKIDAILAEPQAARGFWGVEVVSLRSGTTLYERNAEKLFTPASNTKLFITAAALALIGPEHKFRTTVEAAAAPDRYGRISGDLMLVGRGDPNLSGRTLPYKTRTERGQPPVFVLEQLADQLAARGVRVVEGDVVADDTYFVFERYAEGWSYDDVARAWGAPVSALSLNDNVLFIRILPGERAGEKAFVTLDPFPETFQIDNRLVTTAAGSGPRNVVVDRQPGSNTLTLWGSIPADDTGTSEAIALEDPADFSARIFRRLLERRGINVYGKARARHQEPMGLPTFHVTATASAGGGPVETGSAVPRTVVLATHESLPLLEDLRVINKVSQNLHAEMALRLLGREKGTAGSIEAGLSVLQFFLTPAGVNPAEVVLYDGSGLSRKNLVSPRAVVGLLRYAAGQPWGAAYRETLPVAGQDGSLAERFRGTGAEGRVQAKTGSMEHVKSLSGYLTTLGGEPIAFSILSNNHTFSYEQADAVIDRIVQAVVDDRTARRRKK
ncbi:MAG TPA: D-alanyl-D-alanine carboxypeptidase/D-alanyl-D-alanine-endopeptidase [Terriglobales bacterium]|nr:D-alanyl-D-alanine carboxypeptidase/D-alanyl-D-alanine-endopeptidase [Terriglobales bacterium]